MDLTPRMKKILTEHLQSRLDECREHLQTHQRNEAYSRRRCQKYSSMINEIKREAHLDGIELK